MTEIEHFFNEITKKRKNNHGKSTVLEQKITNLWNIAHKNMEKSKKRKKIMEIEKK